MPSFGKSGAATAPSSISSTRGCGSGWDCKLVAAATRQGHAQECAGVPMRRVLLCTVIVALAPMLTGAAADERRIAHASNVRLRIAPSTTTSTFAELPVGTELVVLDRTSGPDPWYHVKIDDGRDGWVLGRLTRPFDPARRAVII